MALHQSEWAKGRKAMRTSGYAGAVIAETFEFDVTATVAGTVNDVIELGGLPAGHEPIDAILDVDDLDSDGSPAIVLDVGLLDGTFTEADDSRDITSNLFFDGVSTAQAGGVARMSLQGGFRIAATDTDRAIGAKIMTAAATGQAGTLRVTVFYAQTDV